MHNVDTPWIKEGELALALERNEAFWSGELEEYPLVWITVPQAKPGQPIGNTAPKGLNSDIEFYKHGALCQAISTAQEDFFSNLDYLMEATECDLSRTYYAGDALPVYDPWLGPDQFAAWLGAELIFKPGYNTSWSVPLVRDWRDHPCFLISPENRWWKLYLEILRRSVELGRNKWVTGFPDLHTGIDALSALRGPEALLIDLVDDPEAVLSAMHQMTNLWKLVVDTVSTLIEAGGQGSSQWTMGWSSKRFLCIGQMDFTCMISSEMFRTFCWNDLVECCIHVDHALYHLDGAGAIRHLPQICAIEHLDCIQWLPGAGAPPLSKWLDLLHQIQETGKSVQVWPLKNCNLEELFAEVRILCDELDISKLFIVAELDEVEAADALLAFVKGVCASKRKASTCFVSPPSVAGNASNIN
jgi:hypothetical protein